MPSLTIRHVTTYRYRQPVAFGEHWNLPGAEAEDTFIPSPSLDLGGRRLVRSLSVQAKAPDRGWPCAGRGRSSSPLARRPLPSRRFILEPAPACEGRVMIFEYILGASAIAVIMIYLVIALIRPERF
jgi:K+-transporting ATPase KdpF subunit